MAIASVAMLNASSAETLEDTLPEDTRFLGQGLPGYAQNPTTSQGFWIDPQATTLNYMGAAKQWVRPPTLYTVGNNLPTATLNDPTCARLGGGVRSRRDFRAPIVFLNPIADPASSDRFGQTQQFTVRTAAFGSIPVEADVTLEQPQNPQGAVVPAIATQRAETFCAGQGPFPTRPPGAPPGAQMRFSDTVLQGNAAVRVESLRVDGTDLELNGRCAAEGAQLSLAAPDYHSWDPDLTTEERPPDNSNDIPGILSTRFFSIADGGLFSGTLDVPPFTGCRTATGEDLSALLTAAVSGADNPLTVRSQGLPGNQGLGGADDPSVLGCPWTSTCEPRLPPLDIPETEPAS